MAAQTWIVPFILIGLFSIWFVERIGCVVAARGFPLPREQRFGYIDGLRGYLALSVMLHHYVIWLGILYYGKGWRSPDIELFSSLGAGAVAFFFMITGFLFYGRILAGFHETDWTSTFISRVFRICPLLFFIVAMVAGIAWVDGDPDNRGSVAKNGVAVAQWLLSWGQPTLLGHPDAGSINARVLWSLWYEWVFYLAILPFLSFVRGVTARWVPSWIIPLLFGLSCHLLAYFTGKQELFGWFSLFSVGMLVYEARRAGILKRLTHIRWIAPVALIAVIIAASQNHIPYGLPQLLVYGFFFACIVAAAPGLSATASPGAVVLGEVSYGIYMVHGTILYLAMQIFAGLAFSPWMMIAALPVVALLVVLFAMILYLGIERPGIKSGKFLSTKWQRF